MSAPSDPLAIIKPLISHITKMMRPLLGLLMVHTIFGAMLIPLFVALVYFSSARTRKMPLFWAILFDICIGIGIAIWDDYIVFDALFNPENGVSQSSYIAFPIVQSVSTWIVDLTLLMRLIAVYPYSSTPTSKFVALLTFPAMIKITRLVLIATSVGPWKALVLSVSRTSVQQRAHDELSHTPTVVAEFFCELADHLYVSTLFLYKLYGGFSRAAISGRVTSGGNDTLAGRIRTLFYIALGNFIFPVLFNIILIITVFVGNPINVIYIVPTNTYVTIFGVVFATIWNHASHASEQNGSMSSAHHYHMRTAGANSNSNSNSNSKPFSALEFKHDDNTTTQIGAGGRGPGTFISPRGNGGSSGTLAFDNLHFAKDSKSSNDDSFLDITVHGPEMTVRRDTAGVMHRV